MLSADLLPNHVGALDGADNAPGFEINPLSCITSWSPSIPLQPLAADDVGVKLLRLRAHY
jgi:hypothetical protein